MTRDMRNTQEPPDEEVVPSIDYKLKYWQDHVTEYENRYKEVDNGDGTVTHEPIEGEVIQQGTPQNAANFNALEARAWAAEQMAAEAARTLLHHRQTLDRLVGEKGAVALTNSLDYPFNNSKKTVALVLKKDTLDYTVNLDATATNGGSIGTVIVSDKQLNGFKLEFTGGAKRVDVKYIVEGGMF